MKSKIGFAMVLLLSGELVYDEGVIDYAFFTSFIVVIDRLGGKMTFSKTNRKE